MRAYIKRINVLPQRLPYSMSPMFMVRRHLKFSSFEELMGYINPKPALEVKRQTPLVIDDYGYRYKEGKVYHGFQCERVEYIPDFHVTSCTMRHMETGTELWYIDRKDTSNVFSINFRTPPTDGSGVAHVVEHLVLNGSKMFPIRNPFFSMLNRTVATSMNALTALDLTAYIFATRNKVDFMNLLRIYLDSVLRPNLHMLEFQQEGWRLEHKDVNDRNSEIMIKGIVYNEMIGIYSENHRLFRKALLANLLPQLNYRYPAGGDPLEIPNLTYEQLLKFHQKYYHPSNARIYCYGSFDILETLALIDEEYLSHYEYVDNKYSSIPTHPRWSEPRRVHAPCRFVSMGVPLERQNIIGCALLMCDRVDVQEVFDLNVLTELMIRGPNSAFYKGLVEPNFSGGFNKHTGYYFTCRDTYFSVGLQDLKAKDFERFTELFDQTVRKVVNEGFDPQHVESILHKLELAVRHQVADDGKLMMHRSMGLWNHGGDVVANLRISEMTDKLRQNLKKNKKYLQQKVDQYFLQNPHKLTLTMSADKSYDEDFKRAEMNVIRNKLKDLNAESLEEIYQMGLKLQAAQKSKENVDILPCVSLKDVEEPLNYPEVIERPIQNVPTQLCQLATNDVTYLNCLFNITELSEQDLMLVPLFCNVFKNMGTTNESFREFDKRIMSTTAGIDFKLKVVENVKDGNSFKVGLLMSTYALDKNVAEMFGLCQDLLLKFNLEDIDRLKLLVENYVSSLSVGIAFSGHNHVMMLAGSLVTNAAQLRCKLLGILHIDYMKKYVQENSIETIRDRLKDIGSKIFNYNSLRVAINSSEVWQPTVLDPYQNFLKSLPKQLKKNVKTNMKFLKPSFLHYGIQIPLNFCGKTFAAVPYLHEDHPVLRVLAKLISAKYLLPVLREQGGAYGAAAKVGYDGLFNFYTYRDPESTKTLEVFDNTHEWLLSMNEQLDDQILFEAKLGVLQLVDWPIGPGEVGIDYFILRVSYEDYRKYRSRVLEVTPNELRAVIEKYFKEEPKHVGRCILGPKSEKVEI